MFSQMNPTQSDCSCWRNMSFLIIASLPHSFGAERITGADESLKVSLKIAQSLLRRMCVCLHQVYTWFSRLWRSQAIGHSEGNTILALPCSFLPGSLKMEKAKTVTEGASKTSPGFGQLLSWPHPKRNNFRSVPWLLPLPPLSSFPSAFFSHFPPE